MKIRPTCTDSAQMDITEGRMEILLWQCKWILKETLEERNKRLAKMRSEQKKQRICV